MIKFFSKEVVPPNNRLRSGDCAFLDQIDEPFDLGTINHVELLPKAATDEGDLPVVEYYASTACWQKYMYYYWWSQIFKRSRTNSSSARYG